MAQSAASPARGGSRLSSSIRNGPLVAPLLARARETGALTILDGAQSVGARMDPIDTLDPDLLAFPSQKWLLGIEGLAGVRLSRRALGPHGFNPVIGGFLAFADQPMNGVGRLREDARRMQTSGFARPDLVGAARAAGWLAMQVGLPIVATSVGSIPEVAGDAALLVALHDHTALAAALGTVVADDTVRHRLIAASELQHRRFTWQRCADELIDLYHHTISH